MDSFLVDLKNDDVESFKQTKDLLGDSDLSSDSILPDIFNNNPNLIAYASYYGAIDCFNYLIKEGESVENVDDELRSAIHFACAGGNYKMVKTLIEDFDQLNHIDSLGRSPLHYSAEYNKTEIAKLLIATQVEKYEYINGISSFVNKKDIFGVTALHIAVENNNEELVDYLLENSANVNLCDTDGCAVIHIAAKIGSYNLISKLLQNGAKIVKKSKNGRTIFHFAAFSSNPAIFGQIMELGQLYCDMKFNINTPDKFGRIPLHYACEQGSLFVVEELLKLHSDVTSSDIDQMLPIHFAAIKGNAEVIQLLINYKSPVYAKDSELRTPLHIACECGSYKAACFLCRKYKNLINEETKYGLTPLHSLASSDYNADNPELVQFLVSKGSDINKKNKFGQTPLQCAIQNGYMNTISVLVESGADLNVVDDSIDSESKKVLFSPKRSSRNSRLSSAYQSPCSSPNISRKSPDRLNLQNIMNLESL